MLLYQIGEYLSNRKLIKLVKKEAENLRKNATKAELDFLNFERLHPGKTDRCIYGQMTGDCFSHRAHELIRKCCIKTYNNDVNSRITKLNGPLPEDIEGEQRKYKPYYSPIEIFIARMDDGLWINNVNGNNESLIKYLKFETNELELKLW